MPIAHNKAHARDGARGGVRGGLRISGLRRRVVVGEARGVFWSYPKYSNHPTRVPRAWAEWEIALWSKILSTHGVGKAHAQHQEK